MQSEFYKPTQHLKTDCFSSQIIKARPAWPRKRYLASPPEALRLSEKHEGGRGSQRIKLQWRWPCQPQRSPPRLRERWPGGCATRRSTWSPGRRPVSPIPTTPCSRRYITRPAERAQNPPPSWEAPIAASLSTGGAVGTARLGREPSNGQFQGARSLPHAERGCGPGPLPAVAAPGRCHRSGQEDRRAPSALQAPKPPGRRKDV